MAVETRSRFELPSRKPVEVPINLLPQEIVGEQRTRRYFGYGVVGALALVLVLVVVTVMQRAQINSKEKELQASQAQVSALQSQVATLAPFDQLNQDVQGKRQTLATALQGDVNWTRFLDDLDQRVPSDSSLTTLTLTAAAGTTPDGQPAFGTVSYSGSVATFPGLAGWLDTMSASTGLHFVYLGSGSKGGAGAGVSFTATANLTATMLSGRCQTETAPCP